MDINITDFRANLLKYLKLAQLGEEIVITSKGKPLVNITPPTEQKEMALKKLKNIAKTAMIGDVITPINNNWDAME